MELEPFVKAVAVTPSDSTVVGCSAFFVGVTGNVAVVPRDNGSTAVVLKGCIAGHIYKIACAKIMSTSTTATDIVALY